MILNIMQFGPEYPVFKKLVLEIRIQDDFVFKTGDVNINGQPRGCVEQQHIVYCIDFAAIDVLIERKPNRSPTLKTPSEGCGVPIKLAARGLFFL